MKTKRVTTPEKVLSWQVNVQVSYSLEITQKDIDDARFDTPKFKGWSNKAILKELAMGSLLTNGEHHREVTDINECDVQEERTSLIVS